MLAISTDQFERDCELEKRMGLRESADIIPFKTRSKISVSEDAVESLIYYLEENKPHFQPERLGYDIRRSLGEDGFDLFTIAVSGFGDIDAIISRNKSGTRDAYFEAMWSSFDRQKLSSDILLIDAMDEAEAFGWKAPSDISDQLETMRDEADKIRSSFRASEYARIRAEIEANRPKIAGPQMTIPPYLAIVPAAPAAPLPDLIKTSAQFIGDFVPPDYLVDGILERRYFYAITAQTGVGKTAAAMVLTAFVAAGRPLGSVEVEKGTVLYMAGENPTDVQKRWLGVTHYFGMDPAALDVHFIPGSMDLSQHAERISAEVARKNLQPSLVVVDTAAAYNFGDDENSNSQAGNYARLLRSLTTLPGGPCVIVLCHPTKSASDPSELLPRGGGAFLAELDGNIPLARNDSLLVAAPGKMRGNTGWTLRFELEVIRNHPLLRDVKGRQLSTIVARPVDEAAEERNRSRSHGDENDVLRHLDKLPGSSPTDVAKALGWTYGIKNETNRNRAERILKRLTGGKGKPALVKQTRGDAWQLTPAGQVALNDLDRKPPPS
jgi:hypothetical protein